MTILQNSQTRPVALTLAIGLALACSAGAHEASALGSGLGSASHVIVPQSRGWALNARLPGIQVEAVRADVKILEQTATTILEVSVFNPGGTQAEAVLLLPVPADAVVSSFAFEGSAAEPTAQLLPRDEARRLYDSIVSKLRDPALLEFAGYSLIRTSVFPVAAQGRQRVRLTYEHILPADGNRVDYVLPRSESLAATCPWDVRVSISTKAPISMVYSPSHEVEVQKRADRTMLVNIKQRSRLDPGSFFLSYLLEQTGVTASLFAYPDPAQGGGYFLLLAGLPPRQNSESQKREVTLVLDRSGSMAGVKIDQVRAAAVQIIGGMAEGESFNIIDYSTTAEAFAPTPVLKSAETFAAAQRYLAAMRTTGGTNIYDALVEALRQPPQPGLLPIVLFLTDGLPTVGRTAELEIAGLIEKGNVHQRRVFTFGVGSDVNAPLLDRIADTTRATSCYVLAGEDVEVKVASVFKKLYGPALSDLKLTAFDAQGALTTQAMRELIPAKLPDLFEGDQLVVLGQYQGNGPLDLELRGNDGTRSRTFKLSLDLAHATTRNAFVPRLWASRRIALLVEEIRRAGAATGAQPLTVGATPLAEPRYRELIDEILRLSTEFGILSEYTSFLATEGTAIGDWEKLLHACTSNLDQRAVRQRSGVEAISQAENYNFKKVQSKVDYRNCYLDENLKQVEVSGVQQVCDRAFLQQGGVWVDSRVVTGKLSLTPDREVEFGSAEHQQILADLVSQGRQGLLSLPGDTLLRYGGKNVLVKNGETR